MWCAHPYPDQPTEIAPGTCQRCIFLGLTHAYWIWKSRGPKVCVLTSLSLVLVDYLCLRPTALDQSGSPLKLGRVNIILSVNPRTLSLLMLLPPTARSEQGRGSASWTPRLLAVTGRSPDCATKPQPLQWAQQWANPRWEETVFWRYPFLPTLRRLQVSAGAKELKRQIWLIYFPEITLN